MIDIDLAASSDISVRSFEIGKEGAPLVVIDQFVKDAESLREYAAKLDFQKARTAYPGIRVVAPKSYQQFLMSYVSGVLPKYFDIQPVGLKLSMCHYSLVTTAPEQLSMIQRIPHVDSFGSNGLATVHYLFQENWGGTAFYRHRKTGYEIISEERKQPYFASLEAENASGNVPPPAYIDGDTPLFEQIEHQEGIFNRLLLYRRNSLHSGCVSSGRSLTADPMSGRLSINSFIDPVF